MKRILLCLIVVLAMLFPIIGMADDATVFDVNNSVSYTIDMEKYECEIGGEIEYTVHIRFNKGESSYISISRSNLGLIEDDNVIEDSNWINSGEMLSIRIKQSVPEHINWYRTDDGYFMDLYMWFECETFDEDDGYGYFRTANFEPVPIKITNMSDGSEFISLTGVDDIGDIGFDEYIPYKTNSKEAVYDYGKCNTDASITNIGDKEIEVIECYVYRQGMGLEERYKINPKQTTLTSLEDDVYPLAKKQRRNSYMIQFPVTFIMDGKYYGVSQERVYKAIYYPYNLDLKFDVTMLEQDYESLNDEYAFYKIDIKNVGQDISELLAYISGYVYEGWDFYSDNIQNFGSLKKGESTCIYIYNKKANPIIGYFGTGDSIKNKFMFYDYSNPNLQSGYYWAQGDIYDVTKAEYEELNADVQVVEKEDDDTSQSITNDSDKDKKQINDKHQDELVQEVNAQIIGVEKKSSMPLWVWVALAFVIIASIIVIIILRKKSEK